MFPGQTAYIHTCTLNKRLFYLSKLYDCCRTLEIKRIQIINKSYNPLIFHNRLIDHTNLR